MNTYFSGGIVLGDTGQVVLRGFIGGKICRVPCLLGCQVDVEFAADAPSKA